MKISIPFWQRFRKPRPTHILVSSFGNQIRIDLGRPLAWFAFDKQDAVNFAVTILNRCNVPVNVTFTPEEKKPSGLN